MYELFIVLVLFMLALFSIYRHWQVMSRRTLRNIQKKC